MENLIYYMQKYQGNKFFIVEKHKDGYLSRWISPYILCESTAQKICDELNKFLLELKEGKQGRQLLIDFLNYWTGGVAKEGYVEKQIDKYLLKKSIDNL